MPKPKKTKIKLDDDSFQTLLQEIYNDIQSLSKQAKTDIEERNKSSTKPNSVYESTQIGKINNESLKIIDSTIEKKLTLAKLQSQVINKDSKPKGTESGQSGMSNDDKKAIRDLIKDKLKNNNQEFDDE